MANCAQCQAPVHVGIRNCPYCGITLAGIEFETQPGVGVHSGFAAPDGMIGRWVLDQYVVRAKLGEGGMGGVYLADQPAISRQAVIKVIHPWLSRDRGVAARFATEARAAARLQNPHIVSIYNYGKMPDGTLFLAMEYLEGRTLAQLLRSEVRVEPTRSVAIVAQVCEALGHAHARGVVHRDLKPSNIMLVARDRGPEFVKVLDFGIAKLDGSEGTAAGALIGTPQYMSPEQLQGEPVDGRSDLYSVGVVLYQMLSGRLPFSADSAITCAREHVSEDPPPLARVVPQLRIPPALDACIMRVLAKRPHERPLTAEFLADDLWSALMATRANIPAPRIAAPPPPPRTVAMVVGGTMAAMVGVAVTAYSALTVAPPALDNSPVSEVEFELSPVLKAPVAESLGEIEISADPEQAELVAKTTPEREAESQRSAIRRGMPRAPAGTVDRRVDELEAVFLTMTSNYTVAERRDMLRELRNSTAGIPNAEAMVRGKLIEWIAAYGGIEEQIEIIDDEDTTRQ